MFFFRIHGLGWTKRLPADINIFSIKQKLKHRSHTSRRIFLGKETKSACRCEGLPFQYILSLSTGPQTWVESECRVPLLALSANKQIQQQYVWSRHPFPLLYEETRQEIDKTTNLKPVCLPGGFVSKRLYRFVVQALSYDNTCNHADKSPGVVQTDKCLSVEETTNLRLEYCLALKEKRSTYISLFFISNIKKNLTSSYTSGFAQWTTLLLPLKFGDLRLLDITNIFKWFTPLGCSFRKAEFRPYGHGQIDRYGWTDRYSR